MFTEWAILISDIDQNDLRIKRQFALHLLFLALYLLDYDGDVAKTILAKKAEAFIESLKTHAKSHKVNSIREYNNIASLRAILVAVGGENDNSQIWYDEEARSAGIYGLSCDLFELNFPIPREDVNVEKMCSVLSQSRLSGEIRLRPREIEILMQNWVAVGQPAGVLTAVEEPS